MRIWRSKASAACHVSIETTMPPSYISLWPSDLKPKNRPIQFEFKSTYKDDIETESQSPNVVVFLYSLSTEKLLKEWEVIKETPKKWSLLGINQLELRKLRESEENCVSLAFRLLKAGGIDKLLSTSSPSDINELETLIVYAKRKELKKYPEIATVSGAPVDNMPFLEDKSSTTCVIL